MENAIHSKSATLVPNRKHSVVYLYATRGTYLGTVVTDLHVQTIDLSPKINETYQESMLSFDSVSILARTHVVYFASTLLQFYTCSYARI